MRKKCPNITPNIEIFLIDPTYKLSKSNAPILYCLNKKWLIEYLKEL